MLSTCIIVLKKQRDGRDVLFIDASKYFEKNKTQNVMKAEHINHVVELFKNRQDVEKEAHVASFDEIKENDFNLNIPRYIDANEEEVQVNLADVNNELGGLEGEIATAKDGVRLYEISGQ